MTNTNTHSNVITLRPARAEDAPVVQRLAELDSALPLRGDVLLAETRGRPLAALALRDGRAVADPFQPTAEAVALLQMRGRQLLAA